MKIAVIGASGLARELKGLIEDICDSRVMAKEPEQWQCVGLLSDKRDEHSPATLGDFSWLENNHVDALAMGIGSPFARLRLASELSERFPNLQWPSFVHPSVRYHKSCRFFPGSIVYPGNILSVNVNVQSFALISSSCVIGHEATIGGGAVINPLCAISGGVSIGMGSLIGTRSSILRDVVIGQYCVIGPSSLVIEDVPAETTVMGIPALRKGSYMPIDGALPRFASRRRTALALRRDRSD